MDRHSLFLTLFLWLYTSLAFGQANVVISQGNISPSATGQDLGAAGARWDGFFDTVQVGKWNSIRVVDGNKFTTIQAAIDDCPATGCIVFIPAGTYALGTTSLALKDNVWLLGSSGGFALSATIITYSGTTNAITVGVGAGGVRATVLEGFTVQSTVNGQAVGISYNGLSGADPSSHNQIRRVRVDNFATGIKYLNAFANHIADSWIMANNVGISVGAQTSHMTISRTLFSGSRPGFGIVGTTAIDLTHADANDVTIAFCDIENWLNQGVQTVAANTRVFGTRFEAIARALRASSTCCSVFENNHVRFVNADVAGVRVIEAVGTTNVWFSYNYMAADAPSSDIVNIDATSSLSWVVNTHPWSVTNVGGAGTVQFLLNSDNTRLGLGAGAPRTAVDVGGGVALSKTYDGAGGYAGTRSALVLDATAVRGSFQANSSTSVIFGAETNHPLIFVQNNVEQARIDTTAKFGVGETVPKEKLHVAGAGVFTGTATTVVGSSVSLDYISAGGRLISRGTVVGTKGIFQLRQESSDASLATVSLKANAQSEIETIRIKATLATALVAGDFALSAGWGTTATVSGVSGTDQRCRFTVNSSGTGQGANPTITLTFKDGTWTTAPFAVVARNGGNQATVVNVWSATATALTITFNGTPFAGETYTFEIVLMG